LSNNAQTGTARAVAHGFIACGETWFTGGARCAGASRTLGGARERGA
jgi:hypothetical protein